MTIIKNPDAKKFLVIAGEESGDRYAGTLIKHLSQRLPGLEVEGIGGNRFRQAGGKTLFDIADIASVGLGAAFKTYSFLKAALEELKIHIEEGEYDAVILIDFPDFNLRVAKIADSAGTPVFYYVCPQFWAWRSYRIKAVKAWVDMMIVILPFEAAYYEGRGLNARFFGHPILDELPDVDRETVRSSFGVKPGEILLGVLPGSRKGEVAKMAPRMLDAIRLIRAEKKVEVVIPCADSIEQESIESMANKSGVSVKVVKSKAWEVMNAADFLLCKSGTSTLQAAIAGAPMVIVYRADSFSYILAKALAHIKWVGLPNLIAKKEIAPELLQWSATPEKIASTALFYLNNPQKMEEMKKELALVKNSLGQKGAPERSADAIVSFLAQIV